MSLLGTGSDNLAGRYARRPAPSRAAAANAVCQRCLQAGHWTYECKNPASYTARPTRTQQLLNPKSRPRFMDPSELLPEARGAAGAGEDKKKKGSKKRKKRDSSSDSDDSSSTSDSSSSSWQE
ncbi:hypothetical protein WJX81_001641 [Elliptochloris bilobata]|uniref:Zinc knuckle-domain-containing protein n=1 Tax=Elliptochloris bilobata TaxID=381761 RepID=A0AAW1QXS7_9CHLO